jgi:hypothetical protein
VRNCISINAPLDHLYIAASDPSNPATATRNGTFRDNIFERATRSAISVIHGNRLNFLGNTIRNVAGARPQSGINIESNADDAIGANRNILIKDNVFGNIAEVGVRISASKEPRDITVEANRFFSMPVAVLTSGQDVIIRDNMITDLSPARSGWAADPPAAIFATGIAGASLEISGNTIARIEHMSAIYIHHTWSGAAEITRNRVSDVAGAGSSGIISYAGNTTIFGNTIERISDGVGIGVEGDSATIDANVIRYGTRSAVWSTGYGNQIMNNAIVDFGGVSRGWCIATVGGPGSTLIEGNIIRKMQPNREWIAIQAAAEDLVRANYRYGVFGNDGLF